MCVCMRERTKERQKEIERTIEDARDRKRESIIIVEHTTADSHYSQDEEKKTDGTLPLPFEIN